MRDHSTLTSQITFLLRLFFVETLLRFGPIFFFLLDRLLFHLLLFLLFLLRRRIGFRRRRIIRPLNDEAVEFSVIDAESRDDVSKMPIADADDPLDHQRIVVAETGSDDVVDDGAEIVFAGSDQELGVGR